MNVPFYNLDPSQNKLEDSLLASIKKVLNSKQFILGKEVQQFESNFSAFNSSKHTIGVGNGLDALKIALKSLGIGPGDEVIVPSNTYIASWLAVSAVGATPIPVEPDVDTMNIDPKLIEKSITSKTKVIMPVHLFGQACDMDEISTIAMKHKLFVLEDFAQAQGAEYEGKLCGSLGTIGATSFYPSKNLGAFGDGGAITTNNDEFAQRSRVFRNYGSEKKYYNQELGFNSRLDTIQAAILDVKLPHLNTWNAQRIQIAKQYSEELKDVVNLKTPKTISQAKHVYHLYVIQVNNRNRLREYLNQHNIGTIIHYPIPPHLQNAYAHLNYKKGDFPIAEALANNMLSLPLFPGMSTDQVSYVCEKIKNFDH